MKLSLPTHVPIRSLMPVLAVVAIIQLLEGTKVITALEFGAYIAVSTSAFNLVGGLIYPSGAYIFFLTVLTVGLGGVAKTMLGEPLDTNLSDAQRSMFVYLVGACWIWGAAKISVRIRAKRPWLSRLQLDERVTQTALGSALIGQFGWLLFPDSIVSTFNQLNNFLPLSILLLVYAKAIETDGKKSASYLAFLIWAYYTMVWGVFTFSKQGMFLPSTVWAIGALIAGYRTTFKRLLVILGFAILASSILTPLSQIGRIYKLEPNSREIAWNLLTHPLETRKQYQDQQTKDPQRRNGYYWFATGQGLVDRLTMFPIDDALMNVTDQGRKRGFAPIAARIYNMIPRYFLPGEKVTLHIGNEYAHEIGLLSKHDFGTGVSFSPFADAYHCMRWWGLALLMPLLLIMFTVCDSLTGSTRQTIWAALYIMLFTHAAPEGMLNSPFAAISTYPIGITLAALLARYVLPYIGGFLIPPKRPDLEQFVQPRWEGQRGAVRPSMARTIESEL